MLEASFVIEKLLEALEIDPVYIVGERKLKKQDVYVVGEAGCAVDARWM